MDDLNSFRDRMYSSYVSSGQAKRAISTDPEIVFAKAKNFANYIIKRFFFKKNREIAILDLACGSGPYIHYLKVNGFNNLKGVDISEEQVALAHQLGMQEIICKDIIAFLKENKTEYDVILLMDIIEHLTKPELIALLDLVQKSLKVNGELIIHIPNAEGVFGARVRYGDITHEQSFTPFSMKQILHVFNFTDVKTYEDKPVMHSVFAIIRRILWEIGTIPIRLLYFCETASLKPVLSQNMTVTAKKIKK